MSLYAFDSSGFLGDVASTQGWVDFLREAMTRRGQPHLFVDAGGHWITLEGGRHLFIRDGETVEAAIGRMQRGEMTPGGPQREAPLPTDRASSRKWFKEQTGLVLHVDKTLGDKQAARGAVIAAGEINRMRDEFGLKLYKNDATVSTSEKNVGGLLRRGGGLARVFLLAPEGKMTVGSATREMGERNSGQYTRAGFPVGGEIHMSISGLNSALQGGPGSGLQAAKSAFEAGRWTTTDNFAGTFRHEFGHAANAALDRLGKKAHVGPFEFDPKKYASQVSRYSKTNMAELFAESFSMYTSADYGESEGKRLPGDLHNWFTKVLPRKTK